MNMGNFIMYMYIYVLPCLDPNIDVIILRSVAACNGILERKIIVINIRVKSVIHCFDS